VLVEAPKPRPSHEQARKELQKHELFQGYEQLYE
jgi:hypothetical protein